MDDDRLAELIRRMYASLRTEIAVLMSGQRPDVLALRAQLAAIEDLCQALSEDVDKAGMLSMGAAGRLTAEYFAALRPVLDAMEAGQVREVRDLGLEFARQWRGEADHADDHGAG